MPESLRFYIQKKATSVAENTVNAFRVAPQWQLPAIGLTALGIHEGHQAIKRIRERKPLQALPHAVVSVGTTLYGIFSQTEVINYVGQYNDMRERLHERGWDSWIVNGRMRDFCGRRASKFAAEDTGHGDEFREYAESLQETTLHTVFQYNSQ